MAQVYHKTLLSMGTRLDLVLVDVDNLFGDDVLALIESELFRVEQTLSYFNEDSVISDINSTAHLAPYPLDEELWELFVSLKGHSIYTNGAFDIVKATKKYGCDVDDVDMSNIYLVESSRSLLFDSVKCRVDLGAVGKGYALDRVKIILKRSGIESALISFGDSSILAMGSHPMGDCWKIGMRSRVKAGSYLHTFHLKDCSLSTSGNLMFSDTGGTKNREHIVDPKSNSVIDKSELISVKSDSALEAEVLSTALYVNGEVEYKSVLDNYIGVEVTRFDIDISGEESVEHLM